MAIYSDAGALVGTWWNNVTKPQARGPITETTVAPAALTARTDLDQAQQALGKPLPIVIGTGRVDGVYFIGGVETVGTTTYTSTTTHGIPPGYVAVSGYIGGQTFQFGPGPRTTTTSTTTYDNRTLAGYVLAYDVFERGYNLIRLEIDGEVVFDTENSIPETTTFRFYGGRHTSTDPILTEIIGANPGAYQNFVMIFIDGYPADSPPSISAVISNATTDQMESARIEWTGPTPVDPGYGVLTETQAGYQAAYDPTENVVLEAFTHFDDYLSITGIYLCVLDANTRLERYRVFLEGSEGVDSVVDVYPLRGSGHVLVGFSAAAPFYYVVYNIVTGAKVAEHVGSLRVFFDCSQSFEGRYYLIGRASDSGSHTHFAAIDIAAETVSVTSAPGIELRWIRGRTTPTSVSFFGFNPAIIGAGGDALVYEYTFDGSAWSYSLVYTAPDKVQALHYDPQTEYLVVCYPATNVAYVLPDTGAVVDTFVADFLFDQFNTANSIFITHDRYWPMPGYALFPASVTNTVYLIDIAGQTVTLYAALTTSPSAAVFDQNQMMYIVGVGLDAWTVYYLALQVPLLIDLEDIITDAMSLAGFAPADLTFEGIAGRASYGFVVASDTTVQAIGRSLSDIYGFSWCDTGSGFFFKQAARGDLFAVDAAFDTPDIVDRDQPVMSQDEANIRTPSSVEMQYVSKEGQYKSRPASFNMTTGVLNSITTPKFSTPILFSDAEAQRIVQEKFFEFQEKRRTHTLAVAPENITLLPGDIVSFPSGTRTYITRIEEVGIDLRNMGVEISARDFQTDVATAVTAVSNTGPVWLVVRHASGDVTGQTLAVSVGTVTVTAGAAGAAFASVTGQAATVSVGTVDAEAVAVNIANATGQAITASVGSVTVDVAAATSANVTGQSMTASVGTVDAEAVAQTLFLGRYDDTSNASSYSIPISLGSATADRVIYAYVAVGGSAITISSVTIGGVTATVLDGGYTTAGVTLWMAAVPTGTSGNVDITFTGTQNQVAVIVYATYTALLVPHKTLYVTTSSGSSVAVSDIPVNVGGRALLGWLRSGSATAETQSWSGVDTIVADNEAAIEATHRVGSSSVVSTELASTNDFSVTRSAGTFFGVGASIALMNGTSYYTPVLAATPFSSSTLTTFTFSSTAIGTADANRQLVLCFGWASGTNPTVTGVTVDGNAATIISQTTNAAIVRHPWPTGTTATIAITMSASCTAMKMGVYDTRPRTVFYPIDSGSTTATGASVTIADIAVRNGGFLIGGGLAVAAAAATSVYNGVDTLTKDHELQSGGVTYVFFSAPSTENKGTNDPGFSTAGSNSKRFSFASFL